MVERERGFVHQQTGIKSRTPITCLGGRMPKEKKRIKSDGGGHEFRGHYLEINPRVAEEMEEAYRLKTLRDDGSHGKSGKKPREK
jgi:hypothetical protein